MLEMISLFGLLLGVVLLVMGFIFLFTGLTGKGIRVKTAGEEVTEEIKAQKIRQTKRVSVMAGILGIIFGTIGIMTAIVWTP